MGEMIRHLRKPAYALLPGKTPRLLQMCASQANVAHMPRATIRDLSKVRVTIQSLEDGSDSCVETPSLYPLLGGFGLTMREFRVEIKDPEIGYEVNMVVHAQDGRLCARCISVEQSEAGVPVTGTALRSIPVDAYLGLVLEEARQSGGLVVPYEVATGVVTFKLGASAEEWEAFEAAGHRRSEVNWLPSVAKAYRDALGDPDPRVRVAPTRAVGTRLHISRGHASRLVAAARKKGLLGPALPGRGGEALSLRDDPSSDDEKGD